MHQPAELDAATRTQAELSAQPRGKSGLLRLLRTNRLLVVVLAIATVCIAHRISVGEFHINFDESIHAMSGYFFLDFARELPLSHPVAYAQLYYAHYPALSGLVHWPPVFYVCEALSFGIFGPSVASARFTVLCFSLLGIVFWFRLIRTFLGEWPAAFSSLMAALVPSLLLYEKSVMLEVPVLAVCTAAIYYWVRYCDEERTSDLYVFAACTAVAALVKYTSFCLVPFCILTTLAMGKLRLVLRWRTLLAMALVAVAIGYYYYLFFTLHWASTSNFTHLQHANTLDAVVYYCVVAREQLGWPLLLLSVAGMLTCRLWDKSNGSKVMFCWIAACYLTFSMLEIKQGRHVLFWIPAFVYFATGFLLSAWRQKAVRLAGRAAAIVLLCCAILAGWSYQRPYVEGYEAVAQTIASLSDHGVILYDANLLGTFTFYLHKRDPQRRFVVLRKLLYVPRMAEEGGSVELLHFPDEILASLKQYGVRYIVVSEHMRLDVPAQQMLRDMLSNRPQFRLVARIPIQGNDTNWRDSVAVYENTTAQVGSEQQLTIPMYSLPHNIVVPLKDLHAW
jgi:hypothetical protein